jgi:hypothetical protein
MTRTDPRIDVYIAASAAFARPVLEHLRGVVHAGCPEVEESLKWRMPFFSYRGAPLLRRLQRQRAARVRRLDQRCQNRCHPPEAPRQHAGMAGRGQAAPLEISRMLKAVSR